MVLRWWLPVGGLLLGAAIAIGISLLLPRAYTADTELFVSTTDTTSASEALQGGQLSEQRVASYAHLLKGEDLARRVISSLDLQMTAKQLQDQIAVTPVADTVLLDAAVTDRSPGRARDIAAALSTEFVSLVRELETPESGGVPAVKVMVTEQPRLPQTASSPKLVRNTGLGLVAGLMIGAATAMLRVRFDRSVKDEAEAFEITGAPVIGMVVKDKSLTGRHVLDAGLVSRAVEDYRQLRSNLLFLDVDDPPRVIMISSPMPQEGKTTVVLNLALALAETERRVAVVDADLRRPGVATHLGLTGDAGLAEVLSGTASLADVMQPFGDGGLISAVGAGRSSSNPGKLLASGNMRELIEQLRDKNDFVLIDAPPMLPFADATGLAVVVDGVLISLRYGTSRKDQLEEAAASLERLGVKVLGLVINNVPSNGLAARAYRHGQGGGVAPRRSRVEAHPRHGA
jgi:receptor protein-tyrosine kinase